jgi:hypothetical protein
MFQNKSDALTSIFTAFLTQILSIIAQKKMTTKRLSESLLPRFQKPWV